MQEPVTPEEPQGDPATPQQIRDLNAFYYGVVSSRLAAQTSYVREIDASTASFLTIGSTILPIVAGLIWSDRGPIADSPASLYGLLVGFICYLLLALFCMLSRTPGRFDEVPDLEQFREISTQFSVEDLQRALGDACVERYGVNEPMIDRTAMLAGLAMWSLFGQATFLTIAVVAPFLPDA